MKLRIYAIAAVMLLMPFSLRAQTLHSDPGEQPESRASSLRAKLIGESAALFAPAPAVTIAAAEKPIPSLPSPVAASSSAVPFMIAGGALFVAGLIAGGDGGTVLVIAGAGIGAYGLYLYFR